jgi:proline dehydrogenase
MAYLAGDTLADALEVCRTLADRDVRSILCFWADRDDRPGLVGDRYLAAARAIAAEGIPAYLSTKAAALAFDPGRYTDLLAAMPDGVRLHLDSRAPEEQDRALDIAEELAAARPGAVGVTLPSRWRRSLADAARVAELDVSVRLVRGQWADPAGDVDPGRAFLELAEAAARPGRILGLATHDPDVAARSLATLGPATGVLAELEQLFGFPVHRTLPVALAAGVPVRVYVPYSRTRPLPYSVRRAVHDPEVGSWLAQDLMRPRRKRHSVAALLRG